MGLGFRAQVIDAISQAVVQTPGCVLLDVDAGPSTNRTVYTFVGRPEDVVEGALNAARTAFRLIDMSRHKGEGSGASGLLSCPQGAVQGWGPTQQASSWESQAQPVEHTMLGEGVWHPLSMFQGVLKSHWQ